jgi:hypothetical protein
MAQKNRAIRNVINSAGDNGSIELPAGSMITCTNADAVIATRSVNKFDFMT